MTRSQRLGNALVGLVKGKSAEEIGNEFMKDSDAIFGPKGVLSNGSTFVDLLTAKPTVPASAGACTVCSAAEPEHDDQRERLGRPERGRVAGVQPYDRVRARLLG